MKLVTYEDLQGQTKIGLATDGDEVVNLSGADSTLPTTMKELFAAGSTAWQRVAELAARDDLPTESPKRLRAPVPDPGKVVCIGLNYRDHAEETGAPIPTEPVVFNKFPTAVVGPGDSIVLPSVSSMVDYEAELVVVIGTGGKSIAQEKALDHVAGYACGHDVSARDWQLTKGGKQWLLGKTFDTFAPLGPWLITKEEIPDPQQLSVTMRLNGEVMQQGTTASMIFSVAELISYVSQVSTLAAGDLIYTGTPPGVGMARQPPVFLKPGDTCEVEIDGIGVLTNTCQAGA